MGMWGYTRSFAADRRGTVLVLVSVMLPALVGFSVLALDVSRINDLHNDLQEAADAFALAAAAELDGLSDSQTRAQRALDNLVDNDSLFSTAGAYTLSSSDIATRWLKSLPPNDSDAITATHETADPTQMRFIEVTINPTTFATIFPISFLGGVNTVTTNAVAVAGFGSGVCDFTPVYICNPYEGTGITLGEVVADPNLRGRMIELRQQGGASAQNSPGNYGFLVPSDGSQGADAIRDMIAQLKSPACYQSTGVEVRPGFIATVRDALNVRFDIYNGPMNSKKNDANFPPASDVRKGYQPGSGNACNASEVPEPTTEFERMARDSCFYAGTCDALTGLSTGNRVGDGFWDFETYWAENNFDTTGVPLPLGRDGASVASNANPPTRYDLYRYELQNPALVSQASGASSDQETGVPACSSQTAPVEIDRRLLFGAIINCQEYDIGSGASGDEVPPEAFGSFFISETVESGPDQIIRVELVDISGRFGNGSLTDFARDESQLYR